jgi:predicted permease
MTKKLQITLYVVSAYLALFGAMFLFAPSVAERITQTTHDATLNVLYGQYTATFAFVAFMAARDQEATSKLSLAILVLTAGHVMVFSYLLVRGIQNFSQATPPLMVNFVLTVLLFLFRKDPGVCVLTSLTEATGFQSGVLFTRDPRRVASPSPECYPAAVLYRADKGDSLCASQSSIAATVSR